MKQIKIIIETTNAAFETPDIEVARILIGDSIVVTLCEKRRREQGGARHYHEVHTTQFKT